MRSTITPVLRNLAYRWLFGPSTVTWARTTLPNGKPFVSASNALQFTPVYRAVTLIASDIARIELECSNSQADSLLRFPSPYMSAFEFRRAMSVNVLLYGNAFALINRTRGGELLQMAILDPESVSLDVSGNQPVYRTRDYSAVPAADMFHLRAASGNGLWGESPINVCRAAVELMAAQEQMAAQTYSNAANPKVALIHPGRMSPEAMQRLEADYMAKHSGSQNSGRPFIAMEGLKIERISSTIDDTGLEAARKFSIADVSRIYGVPGHLLGDANAGSAYGSLEWMGRTYVDSCLQSWLQCWAGEIVSKLSGPNDRVAFDTDELIRPGFAETMAALRTGIEAGFLTRNEAREELDLAPLPGLDAPTMALNMGTGGGTTNIGSDTSAEAGANEGF